MSSNEKYAKAAMDERRAEWIAGAWTTRLRALFESLRKELGAGPLVRDAYNVLKDAVEELLSEHYAALAHANRVDGKLDGLLQRALNGEAFEITVGEAVGLVHHQSMGHSCLAPREEVLDAIRTHRESHESAVALRTSLIREAREEREERWRRVGGPHVESDTWAPHPQNDSDVGYPSE